MVFVVFGLNHKTAPLRVREQFACPVEEQNTLLRALMSGAGVHDVMMLSTCNRTEFYCKTDEPERIMPYFAKTYALHGEEGKTPETALSYFYLHQGEHGIRHALRVASGLDSMMVGEPQIFGQMKQAYQHAVLAGRMQRNLRSVFQYIFRASKRIRHVSGIGKNPVSIAFAAVQLVGQLFPNQRALNIFIIGSGETSTLVAKYLQKQGIHDFMVASRTLEHAQQLANMLNGTALTIGDLAHYLPTADVVISATSCPLPFISQSLVQDALHQRLGAPMCFLDLAVPRDIEDNVRLLSGAHLYNMDDLQLMIEAGFNERRAAAVHAEQLIDNELHSYLRLHRERQAVDVICDYRASMQALTAKELERAKQKLSDGQCQYRVMSELSDRLLKKLTHTPTVGLRRAARENRIELLDVAHYLFNPLVEN